MPRVAKPKAAAPAKKAVPAKKAKSKLYAMPEKVKEGTIFNDLAKGQWRIGPSIGVGGFGEIYAACKVGQKDYDAVVKCVSGSPIFPPWRFLKHIYIFRSPMAMARSLWRCTSTCATPSRTT